MITYDPVKRTKTLLERGLDFQRANVEFEGMHLARVDDRRDHGEQRFITAAWLDERHVVLVRTSRARARRIISMRPMNLKLKRSRRTWRNPGDAPQLTDEWAAGANLYHGKKLVRRGRPVGSAMRMQTTARITNEELAFFRASGRGWQTRKDEALKKYVAARQR